MLAAKMIACASLQNTTKHIQHLQKIKKTKILQRYTLLEKIKTSLQLHFVKSEDLNNLYELQEVKKITLEIEQIEKQIMKFKC